MDSPDPHALLAIRNAIANASTDPIPDATIIAILRGEPASAWLLRTVFEDVSLRGLARAGAAHGIPLPTILAAYQTARTTATAANPELDRALQAGW